MNRTTVKPLLTLFVLPLLALGMQSCASTQQRVLDAASPYFDAKTLDLGRVLPQPPADNSIVTRSEIELMLKIQQERTPAQKELAQADARVTIYRFADALGNPEGFNAKALPKFDSLFRKVTYEEGAVIQGGKRSFKRPRPFLLEPRIEPVVDKPPNDSYPSGHTMWARTVGLLLADMLPEHREQIMARSDEYAFNRVVAGVHYPSDVESGKLAATALVAFLFASPDFQTDFAEARQELRSALKLPTQH
jgi:acid phosphatase (class A)